MLTSRKDYEEWEQWIGETRKESPILSRSWNYGQAGEALLKRIKEHGVYEWLNRSHGRRLYLKFSWKRWEGRKRIVNNALDEVGLDKLSLNWYVCVYASMCERKTEQIWEVIRRKKKNLKGMKIRKQWRLIWRQEKLWLQLGDGDSQWIRKHDCSEQDVRNGVE